MDDGLITFLGQPAFSDEGNIDALIQDQVVDVFGLLSAGLCVEVYDVDSWVFGIQTGSRL